MHTLATLALAASESRGTPLLASAKVRKSATQIKNARSKFSSSLTASRTGYGKKSVLALPWFQRETIEEIAVAIKRKLISVL